MLITTIGINWRDTNQNFLTTGTISALSGTFSGLTPTHVIFAGTAGLLSGVSGFEFDGTNLKVPGKFSSNGNAVSSAIGTNLGITTSQNVMSAIQAVSVNNFNSGSLNANNAILFTTSWQPTVGSASARTAVTIYGGVCSASIVLNSAETQNYTATTVVGFRVLGTLTSATAGGGVATMTNFYGFAAMTPAANANSVYTKNIAFYDAGQYIDGTKTPSAWGLGINTQSYINASLSIGKNTAPTVPLDVVGAIANTTTMTVGTGFGCNGAAAQTAYASGGAAATTAGAFGFGSDAERAALTTLVANIRLALVANGIMS